MPTHVSDFSVARETQTTIGADPGRPDRSLPVGSRRSILLGVQGMPDFRYLGKKYSRVQVAVSFLEAPDIRGDVIRGHG